MRTTTTYNTLFLNITVLIILVGCSNNKQSDGLNSENSSARQKQATIDSNVIRVYVTQDGKITADGHEISLTNLDSSFSKLKAGNGSVHYSRDNGQGDPPQESMKVMELIVKYSLPVKLFTDNTFSTIVNPN